MNSIFFPDRFWWLRGAQGAILAVTGVCMLVLLINDWWGVGNAATETWVLLTILCVLCGVLSITAILRALEVRRLFRGRLRAIQGDQEAIPLAAINVASSHSPELASETLTLLWQATPALRRAWTGVGLFLYFFLASIAGVGVFVVYLLISKNALHQLPVEISVVVVQGVGIMIIGPLIGLIVLSRISLKQNCCYGVRAQAEGVSYYPPHGKTQFLRWEEICLFEVVGLRDPHYCRYRLYGRKAIAEWRYEAPYLGFVPLDMTRAAFYERNQALLNLITAKTCLLPRTFDKRLTMKEEPPIAPQDGSPDT